MATLLLIVIYTAFIGLGIPDSLFGTAWPAIYGEMGLPFSFGSFVTVIIACGTIISSVISARVISALGTNRVSAYSTLLIAAGLLGFSFAPNIWVMCALAILLGIGAGAIDVALNNYVAVHYNATHMSFLHCFYGIGVSLSPYIMSLVIAGRYGWRGGYRIAFAIQTVITVILFVTLPIWKKVHGEEVHGGKESKKPLSLAQTLKISGVGYMCCLFITSCAIEWTCGSWGSTYLVEYKGIAAEKAAEIIAIYYAGLTLGRLFSGILATKLHSWSIIKIGQIIMGFALLMLLLPGKLYLCTLGMFLIGLGNGPLFPNFNYLAPESFGEDVSQSVIGVQMAAAYVSIMLSPVLCGVLGEAFGMGVFPFFLIAFYAIMIPSTIRVKTLTKKAYKKI